MKTRFIDTAHHALAFRGLETLLQAVSFDAALRLLCAAAESSGHGDLYSRWSLHPGDRLQTKPPHNPVAWLRHNRGPRPRPGDAYPPGADHLRFVIRKDGTRELLSQPYGLSWDALRDLVAWCEGHELVAEVDAYSGHFPGQTLAVRIRRGGR